MALPLLAQLIGPWKEARVERPKFVEILLSNVARAQRERKPGRTVLLIENAPNDAVQLFVRKELLYPLPIKYA